MGLRNSISILHFHISLKTQKMADRFLPKQSDLT